MDDRTRSNEQSAQPSRTTAARFLDAIAIANVDLTTIAGFARLNLVRLDECRAGRLRLDAMEQMRLAAAVVTLAPEHARRAHLLYAQAQTELRFLSGEVVGESSYPGVAASSDSRMRARELSARALEARLKSSRLRDQSDHLCAVTRAFVTASVALRAQVAEALHDEVARFAFAAKARGESADGALAMVTTAVEPALPHALDDRERVTTQVVAWFMDAYYAA